MITSGRADCENWIWWLDVIHCVCIAPQQSRCDAGREFRKIACWGSAFLHATWRPWLAQARLRDLFTQLLGIWSRWSQGCQPDVCLMFDILPCLKWPA